MTTTSSWLGTLVERAVSEYLAATDPHRTSPLPSPFQYHEGLSNILITPSPSLLGDFNILEFVQKHKEVKGVIGDTQHYIRATFTKEALSKPAIKVDGLPLTKFEAGAIFRILACQVRVSDCFEPPKVEIRISSFVVVSQEGGPTDTTHLKKVEEEPSVLMNLLEYGLRRSGSMADSDSENYAPFASQEAYLTQVPYQSLEAASPLRPYPQKPAVSDQLCFQLPGRKTARKAQPRPLNNVSINVPNRDSRDAYLTRRHSVSAERFLTKPSSSTPRLDTQMPLQRERLSDSSASPQETTNDRTPRSNGSQLSQNCVTHPHTQPANDLAKDILGPFCNSPAVRELLLQEPEADTRRLMVVKDVCRQNKNAAENLDTLMKELRSRPRPNSDEPAERLKRKEMQQRKRPRTSSNEVHSTWQRKFTTRGFPRYSNMGKEQQFIVDDDASWDPSLIGQPSIKGQIALEVLERLTRKIDEIARAMHQRAETGESDTASDVPVEDGELCTYAETSPPTKNSANPQMSLSNSSQISWSQSPDVSPERPVRARPRLPPDSSPLKNVAEITEDVTRAPSFSDVDKSPTSSSSGDQDLPSSQPPQAVDSEDEDSLMPDSDGNPSISPNLAGVPDENVSRNQEAPTQSNKGQLLKATPRRIEEPTPAQQPSRSLGKGSPVVPVTLEKNYRGMTVEGPAVKTSTTGAPPHPTASLESMRSIQVSRTPAVQKLVSGSEDQFHTSQLDYGKSWQNLHGLSQANLSQVFLPSSFIVPGTSSPKAPAKDKAAPSPSLRKNLPPPILGQPKDGENSAADLTVEGTDVERQDEFKRKRRHADVTSKENPKRRRVDYESNEPVFRGIDPDFKDWEVRERQERRKGIEEIRMQKETERLAQEQLRMATVVRDDQSVESRGRQVSPRSSVLSLARQHVSTPVTRASDYQSAIFDRVRTEESSMKDPLVDPAKAQEIFNLFRLKYVAYTGGRKQFDTACQLIHRLGQPPRPMWDDFVFRYNEEYLDYQSTENEAGKVPLLYKDYYNTFVEDQICHGKIITYSHIDTLSHERVVKESTPNISAHLLSTPGLSRSGLLIRHSSISDTAPKEPHLPPPPPHLEIENPVLKVDFPQEKVKSQRIDHSQNSSVKLWAQQAADADPPDKIWCEKPAGAESPELHTPPLPKDTADMPILDLEAPASSPIPVVKPIRRIIPPLRPSKGRLVPWASAQVTPLPAAPRAPDPAFVRKTRDEIGKGKAPRRHKDFPVRMQEEVIDLARPVVFQRPRPNAELPITKLEIEFAALDGRKGVLHGSAKKEVDIFSWRK